MKHYVIARVNTRRKLGESTEDFIILDEVLYNSWFGDEEEVLTMPDGEYYVVDGFPQLEEAYKVCDQLYADLDLLAWL